MKYIFSIFLLLLATPASASTDWYVIHKQYGFCYTEDLNYLLEVFEQEKVKYKTKDVVEDNQVVIVTISTSPENNLTFYKGEKRCEKAAEAEKKARNKKLNKYK